MRNRAGKEPFRKQPRRNWTGIWLRNESAKFFAPAGGHCFWDCDPYRLNPGISKTFAFRSITFNYTLGFILRQTLGPAALSLLATFQVSPLQQLLHLTAVQRTRNHPVLGFDCLGAASKEIQCESASERTPPKQPPSIFCNAEPPRFTGFDFLDGKMDGCFQNPQVFQKVSTTFLLSNRCHPWSHKAPSGAIASWAHLREELRLIWIAATGTKFDHFPHANFNPQINVFHLVNCRCTKHHPLGPCLCLAHIPWRLGLTETGDLWVALWTCSTDGCSSSSGPHSRRICSHWRRCTLAMKGHAPMNAQQTWQEPRCWLS